MPPLDHLRDAVDRLVSRPDGGPLDRDRLETAFLEYLVLAGIGTALMVTFVLGATGALGPMVADITFAAFQR